MDKIQGVFWTGKAERNYLGHIMNEIYKEKVYFPILGGRENLTIVDIGANIGITSYYFSQFAKRVISVEPASEHYKCLTKMIKFNGLTNIKPIKKALYMQEGKFPLYKNSLNKTMNSLYQFVSDGKIDLEEVETITIDKLFEEEEIDVCHFLKLDIEGTEGEIICSESFTKVAPKIQAMLIETHVWADRNSHQLEESLKKNGFKIEHLKTDANIIIANR